MSQGQLCYITPVGGGHPDQGLPEGEPGAPAHPITLPPLPPGTAPEHPIVLPPGGEYPSYPIFIPGTPTHPIAPGGGDPTHPIAPGGPPVGIWPPPVSIWPPLDPSDGVQGEGWLLVAVIGSGGYRRLRWVAVDVPPVPGAPSHPISGVPPGKPPVAQPK